MKSISLIEKLILIDFPLIRPLDLETKLYQLLGGAGAWKEFFSAPKNLAKRFLLDTLSFLKTAGLSCSTSPYVS